MKRITNERFFSENYWRKSWKELFIIRANIWEGKEEGKGNRVHCRLFQQQIHAQQLPHGAVVGGLPPAGLLGFAGAAAAAAAAGVPPHLAPPPHPAAAAAVQAQAQALLKPSDLQQHRAAAETPEDRKPIALTDERLRRSVSPSEKFRSRTPDLESDPKRRKEEKLGHVSSQRTCTHTQFFLRLCIKLGFRTARGPRFCFLSGQHRSSNHPFDPPVTRHLRIQGELSSLSRVKFVGEEFSPRASSSKLGSIFEFERSDY